MTEAEALQDLQETEGWHYLDNLLNREIAIRIDRLEKERFASLDEIARLQGEIEGRKRVSSYLNNRLKERGNE